MGKVANHLTDGSSDLPAATGSLPARDTRPGTLRYGLTIRATIELPAFSGARVLAGSGGLHRLVRRLGLLDTAAARPTGPHELLVATAAPAGHPRSLARLLRTLEAGGGAALAVPDGPAAVLPGEMLREADKLRFPLLALPAAPAGAAPPAQAVRLAQALADALAGQATELARAEQVYRRLLHDLRDGGELGELASGLADVLGAAAFLTAPDGRVLAQAGPPADLAAGVVALPGRDATWLSAPLADGPGPHGRLLAFRPGRPWAPTDQHLVDRAAAVAALVLARQRALTAAESRHQADFLRDLLDGRIRDPDRVRARGATLGWDLERPLVVLVAVPDTEPGHPPARTAHEGVGAAWAAAIRERDPRAAVAGFLDEAVAVVGAASPDEAARWARESVAAVRAQAGGRTCTVGVSRPTGRAGLPGAYGQAGRAARIGRQLRGAAAVVRFDELGAFRLLSLIPDSEELTAYVTETLGELASDRPEAADLRHTLRVLLETNLNVSEAARRLHFHYNTLRYRIAKLHRIVGPFTTDPNLRLDLHLALHVEQLRGR